VSTNLYCSKEIPDLKQYEVFDNKNQQAWKTFRRKQLQKKGKVLAEGNEPVAWFETLDLWDSSQQPIQKRSDNTTNNTNNTNTNLSTSDVNAEHSRSCVLKCVLNQPKSGRYLLISITSFHSFSLPLFHSFIHSFSLSLSLSLSLSFCFSLCS
jgi:hypothetical protein